MLPSQPAGWAGRNGGVPSLGQGSKLKKASGSAKSRLSDVLAFPLSSIDVLVYILALDIHEGIWAA